MDFKIVLTRELFFIDFFYNEKKFQKINLSHKVHQARIFY